jgi:hypothetical protein
MPKRVAPVNTMTKITAPNEKRVVSDIYDSFLPAKRNAPSARIDGTQTPTYIPLSLSLWSLPAKYKEILRVRLAAAEMSTEACRITFGFMCVPYLTQ